MGTRLYGGSLQKILLAILFSAIILPFPSFSLQESPLSISALRIAINQSGIVRAEGDVRDIRVMVYIPRDREMLLASHPMRLERDGFGNEYAVLELGSGGRYWIYTIVESKARNTERWRPVVDWDSRWVAASGKAWVSDKVAEFASSYNTSMESVARLVADIHRMVEYDSSVYEYNMDADWVVRNRRGACDEYTNLLIASLRSLGIPARGVVGYAYSSPEDNMLRAHSWVEILTNRGWIEADPTWNELGYVDGAHIRIGVFPDSYVEDRLEYVGTGRVEWERLNETFEILEKEVKSPVRIDAEAYGGYVEVFVKADGCVMHWPKLSECVSSGRKVMEWLSFPEYICNSGREYIFYRPLVSGGICPVSVYDGFGNEERLEIGMKPGKGPDIIVPDVATGTVRISTNPPSIFYANGIRFGSGDVLFTMPGRNVVAAANGSASWKEVEVRPGRVGIYAVLFPMERGKEYNITVVISSDKPRSGMLSVFSGIEWSRVVNVSRGENDFIAGVLAEGDSVAVSFSSDISASARYEMVYRRKWHEELYDAIVSFMERLFSLIS